MWLLLQSILIAGLWVLSLFAAYDAGCDRGRLIERNRNNKKGNK